MRGSEMECEEPGSGFLPGHFLAAHIEGNYKGRDYHRLYVGEIAAIQGTAAYRHGT